jgi:PKD repeat protein
MKFINKIISFLILITILWACYKEEVLPVDAVFSIEVENQNTVPTSIKINNQTQGAEFYKWTFEGGNPANSDSKNPPKIAYNKAGTYNITLEAWNNDGSRKTFSKQIKLNDAIVSKISAELIDSDFPPITVQFNSQTNGVEKIEWTFEGGTPATASVANPKVVFNNGGKHKVTLKLSNSNVSKQVDSVFTFKPSLTADFKIAVAPIDEDFEAPLKVQLKSASAGVKSQIWSIEGIKENLSTDSVVNYTFDKAGNYTITLQTDNGKKKEKLSKTITVKPTTNLLKIENIKLGISTAKNAIGCYYSTDLRRVFKDNEVVNDADSKLINIAFFGLDDTFTYNRFISPNDASFYSLKELKNATRTNFYNLRSTLSASNFDIISNGNDLKDLKFPQIVDSENNLKLNTLPQIVTFKTDSGRNGVIKVKEIKKDGANSYIVFDLKMQKN